MSPEAAPQLHDALYQLKNAHELPTDTAVEWLSYADVLRQPSMPADQTPELEAALSWTRQSPSGMKYVSELQSMVQQHGAEAVLETAESLRGKALAAMRQLGVEPSAFSNSYSWILWDLAKQSYLVKHPEESSTEYWDHRHYVVLGDPLSEIDGPRKQREIIHRHVGWEIDRAVGSGKTVAESLNIAPAMLSDVTKVLEDGERNKTGQLRSFVLVQLGRRSLRAAGVTLNPQESLRLIA